MRRPSQRALPSAAILGSVLCLALAGQVNAQSPSPSPSATPTPAALCAVLSPDEIGAVVGLEFAIGQNFDGFCSYETASEVPALTVRLEAGTIEDVPFADQTATVVGDRRGAFVLGGYVLYTELDEGMVVLQLLGYTATDPEPSEVLLALAPIVVSRLGSAPDASSTPSEGPVPSSGETTLAALFPAVIHGVPLEVVTVFGSDLDADAAGVAAISAGLAALDRTLDDLSVAYSSFSPGGLSAIRIRGVDIASVQQQLLPLAIPDIADPRIGETRIAGKRLTTVKDGPGGSVVHLYPRGDVLWVIDASEPDLSEIVGLLR